MRNGGPSLHPPNNHCRSYLFQFTSVSVHGLLFSMLSLISALLVAALILLSTCVTLNLMSSLLHFEWCKNHQETRFEQPEHLYWAVFVDIRLKSHFKPPYLVWVPFAKNQFWCVFFFCLFGFPDFLKSICIQSGYAKNLIWVGSLNKALEDS